MGGESAGGDTGSQVDSFAAFSKPAGTVSGFDATRGGGVPSAGLDNFNNGTAGPTGTGSGTILSDAGDKTLVGSEDKTLGTPTAPGEFAGTGRRSAKSTPQGSKLGSVDEIDLTTPSIDKLGANSVTPTSTTLSVADQLAVNTEANFGKSLAIGALPGGIAALTGIAASPKIADALGFDRPIAGHKDDFKATPTQTPASKNAPQSPFGGDESGNIVGAKSASSLVPTSAKAATKAIEPTALEKEIAAISQTSSRINRAQGRASSTSSQGGKRTINVKSLLGS